MTPTKVLPRAKLPTKPRTPSPRAKSGRNHQTNDTQTASVPATRDLPEAIRQTKSNGKSPRAKSGGGQSASKQQVLHASTTHDLSETMLCTKSKGATSRAKSGGGQLADGRHDLRAPTIHNLPETTIEPPQAMTGTSSLASFGGDQSSDAVQTQRAPANYAQLRAAAELFVDMQDFRKATMNKLRSESVEPEMLEAVATHLDAIESEAKKALRKSYRTTVPESIRAWQAAQLGVGEHLIALLIGSVGDIRVASPLRWDGRGKGNRILVEAGPPYERTISQLWAYCGLGDSERKPRSGMSAEELLAIGSPRRKAIVWNIACGCVKAGIRTLDDGSKKAIGHYGAFYLDRRTATEDRVHTNTCVRCGPAGKPAQPGSPWSKAHQHADALRVLGKEVLRDLWIVAGSQG